MYKLLSRLFKRKRGFNSGDYWEERYLKGRTSGEGSYGHLAEFKSETINEFVDEKNIETVVEFGCGDGNQLGRAKYPVYVGYDVSSAAVDICKLKFDRDKTKTFKLSSAYEGEKYDLSLSLDVIFHLVEDEVFEEYMDKLFQASNRYVMIYSNDEDFNPELTKSHVKSRKFSRWIEVNLKDWKPYRHIKNQYPEDSVSDFFIYEKQEN